MIFIFHHISAFFEIKFSSFDFLINLFANFDIEVWRNAAKIGDTLLDTHSNEQSDEVTIRRDGSLFN